MRTDFPHREHRSRPELSSKPQWGHVRVGTSVIVGGIELTSVDIVTGSCQSARRGPLRRRHPARGPPARARAPGLRAGVPQHVLGPRRRWRGGVELAGRLRDMAAGPRLRRRALGRRPRAARWSCARRCAGCAAPTTTTATHRQPWPRWTPSPRRGAGAALAPSLRTGALEPAGDGPDAACALALGIVFAARADGTFDAAQGVPARRTAAGPSTTPRATAPGSGARCASAATAPRARCSARRKQRPPTLIGRQ